MSACGIFLGCPGDTSVHIGLYQPVIDRFLFVVDDLELATQIIHLASGRYSLYACDLTTARNYHRNVIDNTCCQNWTLADRGQFSLITPYLVTLTQIDLLVESGPNSRFDPTHDQSWLQMMHRYLILLNVTEKNHDWFNAQSFVYDMLDLDFECDHTQLIKSIAAIRRELYLTRDLESSEDRIQRIIKQTPYLEYAAKTYV